MDNFPIKTRLQNFLANIAGQGDELEPRTRKEAILAKAAGRDVDIEPRTGTEYWMLQAAENGGTKPEGTKTITENGTYDVTEYAEAEVDVPGTGKVWPLNVKAIGGTVYIKNPAYFEVGGNYSISPDGQSYGVTTSPLSPNGVNINCKALKTSYPGFSGSFLLDFLVVEAPNQKRIAVGETNCTVTVVAEGLSAQYNKNTIVVKVEGRKSDAVVANPYMTFVISDPS